jgi:hypothetical protein
MEDIETDRVRRNHRKGRIDLEATRISRYLQAERHIHE